MNPLAKTLQRIFDLLDASLQEKESRGVLTALQECVIQAVDLSDLAQENEALASEIETLKERQKKELHILKSNHEGELQRFHVDSDAKISVLRAELDLLLKEKKERAKSEEYPELPREQFWVLDSLPIESVGCLKTLEIAEKQLTHYERTPSLHFEDEKLLRVVEKLANSSAVNIEFAYRGRSKAGGVSEDITRRLSMLRSKGLVGATNLDKQGGFWFIQELGMTYFREHRGPRPDKN